ncbi:MULTISPECIES: fatty acid--CoA ligase family protein [unclassified Salinibacterium]|uniref:class I adenylate-forming enzyme family protein n=1 Tax=unclassified Salinibacterium TaxID=2632331 RepID=UPI0014245E0A|nr:MULTISPECIES: fatty acid--CoA ligase family protein [unclassified Salinibacterium]
MSSPRPFEHLRRNAENAPNGIFSLSAKHTTTNAAALVAATQIAYELRRIGVRPGDIVSLDLPDQLGLLFVEAIYHEAAISTMLPRGFDAAESLPVSWTFTTRPDGPRAGTVIDVDAAFLRRIEENPYGIRPSDAPIDTLRIIFSSGTTGTPKAIAIDTRMYDMLMRGLPSWFTGGPTLNLMSTSGAGGFGEFMLSVAAGQPYVSAGSSTPAELIQLIDTVGITHLKGSPAQLAAIMAEARRQGRGLPAIDSVAVSGGTLSPTTAENMLEITGGCSITVSYGSTEAGPGTRGVYQIEQPALAGRVLPGSVIEVVGDDDQPLPAGQAGRIRHRSPVMAHGYLGDPATTLRAFRGGWFYPGDRGILDADGLLTVLGREAEQINAGGTKLDPVRLDHAALRFPGVRDACGFATPTTEGVDRIGLAIVTDEDFDRQALIQHLRTELGPAAPTLLARLDAIPRTEAGKPLRRELSERYAER